MRRWVVILYVILLPTLAWCLPHNDLAWTYGGIPANTTLTGFQVRRCVVAACGNTCTMADLAGGSVGPAVFTYSDMAVNAAISYLYEVQAVGTADGIATRSVSSNQICKRVKRPPPHSIGGGKIVR